MSTRTLETEILDLSIRLMDSGLPEASARKEAERIAEVIGSHYRLAALTEAAAAVSKIRDVSSWG